MTPSTQRHANTSRATRPAEVLTNDAATGTQPRKTSRDLTLEDVIARALRAQGLSQKTIAHRLGLSQQAVSDRITGKTHWRTTELPVVAQLCGTSLRNLYAILDKETR